MATNFRPVALPTNQWAFKQPNSTLPPSPSMPTSSAAPGGGLGAGSSAAPAPPTAPMIQPSYSPGQQMLMSGLSMALAPGLLGLNTGTDTGSTSTDTSSGTQSALSAPALPSGQKSASPQVQSRTAQTLDSSSHQAFVNSIYPLAKQWEAATGIPADVFTAIAISESGWGQASGNELFGIKGSGLVSPTWEVVNGQPVQTTASFQTYATPNDAFQGFWNLMQTPRYAGATNYLRQTGDWQGFLQRVNAAGYATDPVWYQHIARIKDTTVDPMLQDMGSS